MDDVPHLSTTELLSNNITNLNPRVEDERNVEYNVSDNRLYSLSFFSSECRCSFYTRLQRLGRQVEYDHLNIAVDPMLPLRSTSSLMLSRVDLLYL